MNEPAIEIEGEDWLLSRLQRSGDAQAFAKINRLYAAMVFSTCLRVCGNAQCAADATQETFFELLRNTGRIKGSLGGWLHRVATRRTIDLVRRDSARQLRERDYVELQSKGADSWAEVSPLVDEALEKLDEDLRAMLIAHFLQGQTTTAIAEQKGSSQSTVSRRIQQGLEELRSHLRKKGVLVSAAVLGSHLALASQTLPIALAEQLGKMTMISAGATAHSGLLAPTGLKLAIAAVLVGAAGYGLYQSLPSRSPISPSAALRSTAAPADPASVDTPPVAQPHQSSTSDDTAPSSPALDPPPQSADSPAVAATPSGGWTAIPGTGLRVGIPSPTTPAGAVWAFVMALQQSPERVRAAFVPGAPEADSLAGLLENPQTDEQQRFAHCLESIGIPVRIVQANATPDGLLVRWEARVHTEFTESYSTEDGTPVTWHVNDWFPMETRVREIDGKWKIIGL